MEKKIGIIVMVGILLVASISAVALLTMANGNSATVEKKANFVVTSLSINKHNVLIQQNTIVTVGIMNNGTADGDYLLNLSVDNVVIHSAPIHLGMGNSTTTTFDLWSGIVGNHTVSAMNCSTYLNCYDHVTVGDYLKYHMTGYETGVGSIDANMIIQIISANDLSYTQNVSYSGINLPYSVTTHPLSEDWSVGLENLTFVGMENVLTHYGTKNLSHYTYTYDSGSYHYIYDLYVDRPTGLKFRIIGVFGGSNLTLDLVDTNRPWVPEI